MKIAAAAYPLDWFDDINAYAAKLSRWVADAADLGAGLLVFPEYGAMELASLGGEKVAADPEAALHEVARHKSVVDKLHCDLTRRHSVHILGGSGPVFVGARPVNRATFYGPGGILGHQDKQIMTRFEREPWRIEPGDPLTLFDTPLGKIGVLICYDSEFPLLARALCEAGAEILLAPSCTDSLAGLHRVRIGAMARALENQCVVAHSATIGPCPWCPPVDANVGRAAIYGPPDIGWPDNGILAETAINSPGWAVAEFSRAAIATLRADGGVLNLTHWTDQAPRLDAGITRA
ncbi:MAG: carbon-nitrogen hydrolase family protein [Pseudorhodobacter sp.]|nr:carbon-nitrogen hydrolase family protein [Pseudorhodobacter sp.]